ncbi:cytochrome P450 [Actinomadura sp. DC4]|uniref:cytochrome P450 n=1 Tax=Actinomadura sp. DC4 TaxID=3055069 RepID=UPI0025B1701A|nr:cytochrome P450 [Actinomadura sp. DC4]MDN3354693.1 cytochrome P450 [Actinomadura sp. DC4]
MPTAVADGLDHVNLTDPATFVAPDIADLWRRLRRDRPVHLHPATERGPAFWVLTRYADVLTVYKDPERFGSGQGNMLTSLLAGGDAAGGKLLAVTDPPRHTAVRMMLLKSFSPRVLRLVADGVRARAERLVTAAVAAGSCDFARDVAEQVPMGTICDLLGVPESDQAELLRLSKSSLSSDEPDQSDEATRLARNEILLYFADLAQYRRSEPRDDVVSALATCRIEGEPLTEEEVVLNCYGLVLAGDETSRLAMIGAVVNFTRHPGQWEALREEAVPLGGAVEEILRWTTPAMHLGRTARADVTVGGRTIRAGDVVTAWNVSANRDEEVFADPEVFDLSRSPNKHLTFGYGPHFCLGAYLGRAEVAAMVDSLRRNVETIELTGEPKPLYSTFLRGYSSAPVHLSPGAR